MDITNILNLIKSGLVFFIILCVVVFIHELGHYIAARLVKAKVEKFAIGFGPAIWKKVINDTEYRLNILPLGGYCQIKGETTNIGDEDALSSKNVFQKLFVLIAGVTMNLLLAIAIFYVYIASYGFSLYLPTISNYTFVGAEQSPQLSKLLIRERNLSEKSIFKSLNIPADKYFLIKINDKELLNFDDITKLTKQNCGKDTKFSFLSISDISEKYALEKIIKLPSMDIEGNCVLNIFPWGDTPKLTVTSIVKDTVISKTDIKVDEVITKVNQKPVNNIDEFRNEIFANCQKEVDVLVYNIVTKESRIVKLTPPQKDSKGQCTLGVGLSNGVENLGQMVKIDYNNNKLFSGISHTYNFFVYNFVAIKSLVVKAQESKSLDPIGQNVGTIVRVAEITNVLVKNDAWSDIVNLTAQICIGLAFMNLLPIPPLDGGLMVIAIIESIIKKPLNDKVKLILIGGGWIFFMGLFILLLVKDIQRIFGI